MQSRLTPLRFAEHICHAPAAKKRCGLSAVASAPQISVVYTIDCLLYVFSVGIILYKWSFACETPAPNAICHEVLPHGIYFPLRVSAHHYIYECFTFIYKARA